MPLEGTPTPTHEQLFGELVDLRLHGLPSLRTAPGKYPHLTRLASIGLASQTGVAHSDVERTLEAAIDNLEGDEPETQRYATAVRYSLGLIRGTRTMSPKERRSRAAEQYDRSVERYRQGREKDDLSELADELLRGLSNPVVRRRYGEVEPRDEAATPGTAESSGVDAARDETETIINSRRRVCEDRWRALHVVLDAHAHRPDEGDPTDHRSTLTTPALPLSSFVFAIGSMARGEASVYSDLDLFIVDDLVEETPHRLTRVETSHVIATLDLARHDCQFQPFSRGGDFLVVHSLQKVLAGVGDRGDESSNRMTVRMLLLTNSRALHNDQAMQLARKQILDLYWITHRGGVRKPFVPTFLFNDLRRLWSTMCLNFESNNTVDRAGSRAESSWTRRANNLKLRTTQMVGCFTPVLGLLAASDDRGVLRPDAEDIMGMTSTQRLQLLTEEADAGISTSARRTLELYAQYLEFSNVDKNTYEDLFNDQEEWNDIKQQFSRIGDSLYELQARLIDRRPSWGRYVVV